MTPEEQAKEEKAIIAVSEAYNRASESKNWAAMVETLASEVIFFGTDSSEIIKSFAEFKEAMNRQWNKYDHIKYGDMVNVSIQMDKAASFASIIYGTPCTITKSGNSQEYFLRVARLLKKEADKWVIVSGIVGITRDIDQNLKNTLNSNNAEAGKN